MLLSCSEMRALESRAFADGVTAEALMAEAGESIAAAVRQFFPAVGRCVVFFGKGHNGGDALVAARHLAACGWRVELRPAFPRETWSELTAQKHAQVGECESAVQEGSHLFGHGPRPLVVLDGLLGIGAGGALREPILEACREVNRLRREENAHVFALDIPTGLDGDTGAADADAVVADITLTIGFAKTGLLADGAINHVGRLSVLPLAELSKRAGADGGAIVATADTLAPLLARRNFNTHKGDCGRVGIIAGSLGFTGAAAMCAEAAVRGGAGLVTLYVPADAHAIVAARTAPEVMVQAIRSPLEALDAAHDVLAIGPGLGLAQSADVLELITRARQPVILDADALNILAGDVAALDRCAGPRLLTPHPGEMARLDAESPKTTRRETVERFTQRFPHALLLKGARSLIGQRGRALSYNPTGHPGLASGGIGDVLTGLVAALAAQGCDFYDAARVGSWLIGRAAELAIFRGTDSAESLRATSVLEHFGAAFRELRAASF